MIVFGIIIALSMIFSLFVGLGGGGTPGNSPLPESERFDAPVDPLGALDAPLAPLALASPATGPPASS